MERPDYAAMLANLVREISDLNDRVQEIGDNIIVPLGAYQDLTATLEQIEAILGGDTP